MLGETKKHRLCSSQVLETHLRQSLQTSVFEAKDDWMDPKFSGWWFQPIWKKLVKMGIFQKLGWNQKIFETTI